MNYWKDEFIDHVDSDHVLIIQDDAVLCHAFNASDWDKFSYVGSVWGKKSFQLSEGICQAMPIRWNTWIGPQKRWERQEKRGDSITVKKRLPRPDILLDANFPDVCKGDGVGPIGNGGLSLRRRSWLIKAIETCPHVTHSGVDMENHFYACKVFEDINEDLYFGIALRGIGAPLPAAYKAALFSTEMLWPEEAMQMYGSPSEDLSSPKPSHDFVVHHEGKTITVPAGVHKPWWYQGTKLLLSQEMDNACPFLKYIFHPEQSRWKEWQNFQQPGLEMGR